MIDTEKLKAAALAAGGKDWKWWDSCSFRRLTFIDGQYTRDGSALSATVQAHDGHPDLLMGPGVRELIELASPAQILKLIAIVDSTAVDAEFFPSEFPYTEEESKTIWLDLKHEAGTQQTPVAAQAPANIEIKVYKDTPEHSDYLSARFNVGAVTGISFEWAGHRWSYRYTSFDDNGEYDLLWRPAPQPPVSVQNHTGVNNKMVGAPVAVQKLESPEIRELRHLIDRGALPPWLKSYLRSQPPTRAQSDDDIGLLVRVLDVLHSWASEDWNELLERNPAIIGILRPLVAAAPTSPSDRQMQQLSDDEVSALAQDYVDAFGVGITRARILPFARALFAQRDAAQQDADKVDATLINEGAKSTSAQPSVPQNLRICTKSQTADQPSAPGWKAIESAPVDGTEFQAFVSGSWEPRCRINPDSEAFEIWGRVDYDIDGWDSCSHLPATHWMPLPTPPAGGQAQQDVEWLGYRPLLKDANDAKQSMREAGIPFDKFGVMFPELMRRYLAQQDPQDFWDTAIEGAAKKLQKLLDKIELDMVPIDTCYGHIQDIIALKSKPESEGRGYDLCVAYMAGRTDGRKSSDKAHQDVIASHGRLVRELDALINGEGAARQASLCDIVSQVKAHGLRSQPIPISDDAWLDGLRRAIDGHDVTGALIDEVMDYVSKRVQPAVGDDAKPDMFWNADDPEQCQDSIHNLLVEMQSNRFFYFGDIVEVQQAVRVPNISVRITSAEDDEGNGDMEYEVIDAAMQQGGRS